MPNPERSINIAERAEAMTKHIPGVLFLCAPTEGFPLLWVSGQTERIFGMSKHEVLRNSKLTDSQFIHFEDRKQVMDHLMNAVRMKNPWQLEYRMGARMENTIWVHASGCGVYDEAGQLIALEGVMIDTTAQMTEKEDWQSRIDQASDRNVSILSATSDILETLQSLSVLSINASIEAARAGDAGRGFSVVAQEMNRLAARAENTATAIRRATGSTQSMGTAGARQLEMKKVPARQQDNHV